MNNYLISKLYALYHYYCKYRLGKLLPEIHNVIKNYTTITQSTGTKYPTLFLAVDLILKKKPRYILESGTGTSTLVLAEAVMKLQKKDPSYKCKIISMESIPKYFEMAEKILPEKYSSIVEIRLGEREVFKYSIFRGYCHSNIPDYDYDFSFLDGPNYNDDKGSSTCMDSIKIRLKSRAQTIACVVDTRVSSVFMLQQIFGTKALKYFPFQRTCSFDMCKISVNPKLNSKCFNSDIFGKLKINSNSYKNFNT